MSCGGGPGRRLQTPAWGYIAATATLTPADDSAGAVHPTSEELGLTAGNLSRHLTVLEEAGLVVVEKGYAGRRPRTWVSITGPGRAALTAELAVLTEILRRHQAVKD